MQSNARFQQIADCYGANDGTLFGIRSLVFLLLLRALSPLTSISTEEIFTPHRFERRFLPGFIFGAVIASGVVLAFLISGMYRYFGIYVQLEDATLTFVNIAIRVIAL